jgi:hypothetical protein
VAATKQVMKSVDWCQVDELVREISILALLLHRKHPINSTKTMSKEGCQIIGGIGLFKVVFHSELSCFRTPIISNHSGYLWWGYHESSRVGLANCFSGHQGVVPFHPLLGLRKQVMRQSCTQRFFNPRIIEKAIENGH